MNKYLRKMKKSLYFVSMAIAITLFISSCEKNQDPIDEQQLQETYKAKPGGCTTIQSGNLVDSQGETITTGYTDFGYNYQAHIYNGDYYGDGWHLVMKWNDAWLSNKDCDGDGLLDRHLGYDSYIGSGAWCTNHWTYTYYDQDGNECEYDEFIKIIAVPADATLSNGMWYNPDGDEIGPEIWGQFAIIQLIINDPCEGVSGVDYKSADHPGLGNW